MVGTWYQKKERRLELIIEPALVFTVPKKKIHRPVCSNVHAPPRVRFFATPFFSPLADDWGMAWLEKRREERGKVRRVFFFVPEEEAEAVN